MYDMQDIYIVISVVDCSIQNDLCQIVAYFLLGNSHIDVRRENLIEQIRRLVPSPRPIPTDVIKRECACEIVSRTIPTEAESVAMRFYSNIRRRIQNYKSAKESSGGIEEAGRRWLSLIFQFPKELEYGLGVDLNQSFRIFLFCL